MDLPYDIDTQALAAHLAGIRTRIATLLSQAENGTAAVSVSLNLFSNKIAKIYRKPQTSINVFCKCVIFKDKKEFRLQLQKYIFYKFLFIFLCN